MENSEAEDDAQLDLLGTLAQPTSGCTPLPRCDYCGTAILNLRIVADTKLHPMCAEELRAKQHEPRYCEWCGDSHRWAGAFYRCRFRYERSAKAVREWLADKHKLTVAAKRSLLGARRRRT